MFSRLPPHQACLMAALAAAAALAVVLVGQYAFGLHPCHLCMYQRYPFVAIIVLGLAGFFIPRGAVPALSLSGFAFLIDAGIAFYHSGIERKWWAGLAGCSTPDMSGSIQDLIKRIEETAVVKCDEIPWSFMGLSIANYNVIFCAASAILCLAYLRRHFMKRSLHTLA